MTDVSCGSADAGGDLVSLPDAELVFGLGADLRHAVTREMALRVGDRSSRDAVVGSVCGELVQLAPRWGAYERDSRYLQHGHVCAPCTWIVASTQGRLSELIDSVRPSEKDRDAIAGALGDPLLGVRLLQAIAADDELSDGLVGSFSRSQRTDVLAHAAAHLPAMVVCEECADGLDDGHGDDGSCATALCMACTLTSGPWAGEWEGFTLDECVVQSPCSVLRAMCDHYNIALPQRLSAAAGGVLTSDR